MMKRLTILLLAVCALAGCKKTDFVLPDKPFATLSAEKVQSDAAWADIVPENNDFYYAFVYIPKSVWDVMSADLWVDATDRAMRNIYEALKEEDTGSFQDACLYREAWYIALTDLTPDTEYCMFTFPYDQNIMPVKNVTTCFFTTPKAAVSDITFTVDLNGSSITITPSNDRDSYFWTYERKKTVEKEAIDADYYYRSLVKKFWEYGMFPDQLVTGTDTDDMSLYYDLEDGDQFYVMASGYDNGISSAVHTELITYTAPAQ